MGLDNIGNLVGFVRLHMPDGDVGGALDDADLAVALDGEGRFRHVHGHGPAPGRACAPVSAPLQPGRRVSGMKTDFGFRVR